MKMTVVVLAAAACSSFDGFEPQYQTPPNWGKLTVSVGTLGQSAFERNDYVVSLDSAIQGYGARRISANADTVQIYPVLAGRHQLTLRGVKPNCEVDNGTDREFVMFPSLHLKIGFTVRCVPR
jgi:hypothetical protein